MYVEPKKCNKVVNVKKIRSLTDIENKLVVTSREREEESRSRIVCRELRCVYY